MLNAVAKSRRSVFMLIESMLDSSRRVTSHSRASPSCSRSPHDSSKAASSCGYRSSSTLRGSHSSPPPLIVHQHWWPRPCTFFLSTSIGTASSSAAAVLLPLRFLTVGGTGESSSDSDPGSGDGRCAANRRARGASGAGCFSSSERTRNATELDPPAISAAAVSPFEPPSLCSSSPSRLPALLAADSNADSEFRQIDSCTTVHPEGSASKTSAPAPSSSSAACTCSPKACGSPFVESDAFRHHVGSPASLSSLPHVARSVVGVGRRMCPHAHSIVRIGFSLEQFGQARCEVLPPLLRLPRLPPFPRLPRLPPVRAPPPPSPSARASAQACAR
mmetsp:Transcript_17004/g.50257  ORF Transcript_17004/g.50257 Transcript_17004/m.50257 type:complete len:332 (-) Transcript_17004:1169-2164(-)